MRRSSIILILLGLVMAAFGVMPVAATHVVPTLHQGNPTCGDLGDFDHEFKVEPVSAGLHDDPDSAFTVTITLVSTTDGPTLNFSSNLPVNAVFVKGGPGGNLYNYGAGATADTGLHAPGNNNGTAVSTPPWQGLSHVSFCFNDVPATPTPTPSPTPPTTPGDVVLNVTTCPLGSETLPAGLSVIRFEHPLLAILLLNVRIDGIAVQPGDLREAVDGGTELTVTAGVHSVEVTNAVTDEVLYENEALDCPECSAATVTPPPAAPTEPVPLVPNTAMPLSGIVAVVGVAVLLLGGLLLFNTFSVSRRT